MKTKFFLPLLLNTCIIFTFFSLITNSFFAILLIGEDKNPLLNIGQNILVFFISSLISLLIVFILYKLKKNTTSKKIVFLYFTTSLYTILFASINFITIFYKNIWNIFSILIIFVTSILITVVNIILPIKKSYIKAIINFIIFAVPYFIIFVWFGNSGENNRIIISIFVYIVLYTVITLAYYLTKSFIFNFKNNNTKYNQLFK